MPLLMVLATGISNLHLTIPKYAMRGNDVSFISSFNLQDDKLYSIKWYRGTYEIFRFIPSETPPAKVFPLEGFNVSSASTRNTLTLFNISFLNSGAYSCEVTAEDSFYTIYANKSMLVIDLPDNKPLITGETLALGNRVGIGETVHALCTSWQSYPPTNLTWFINGELAVDEYRLSYELDEEYDHTYTSILRIEFVVQAVHFRRINGTVGINLKCTSSMFSFYSESTRVLLEKDTLPCAITNGGCEGGYPDEATGGSGMLTCGLVHLIRTFPITISLYFN